MQPGQLAGEALHPVLSQTPPKAGLHPRTPSPTPTVEHREDEQPPPPHLREPTLSELFDLAGVSNRPRERPRTTHLDYLDMAENAPSTGASAAGGHHAGSSAAAGIPFYEKQRQHLKEMIARKRALEKRMVRSSPLSLSRLPLPYPFL